MRKSYDSYIETIAAYCEHFGVEPEDIAPMVGVALKDKIEKEVVHLRLLKPSQAIEDELEYV